MIGMNRFKSNDTVRINMGKKYLVLSKNTMFLEKVRTIIYEKLNIADIHDIKNQKNSMTFETIIFKDGGYVKFVLHDSEMVNCNYDVVLVDSILYGEEYISIRSKCILANIISIVDNDILQYVITIDNDKPDTSIEKILHRDFSDKSFVEYGICPKCGTTVYDYDKSCPTCNTALDWTLDKQTFIENCKKHGGYNSKIGDNIMNCDENFYNPYYCFNQTFTEDEINNMSDKEIDNLRRLAATIISGLY